MTKMPWFERPLCAFDTETTGPKPKQDRLVTACVARIDGAAVQLHNYIADPGIEIPAEATEVHGVTTEYDRFPATGMAAIVAPPGTPTGGRHVPSPHRPAARHDGREAHRRGV